MADFAVRMELDDNGDVVRMVPAATVVNSSGDTVTYYLSPGDGTDWQWVGYSDSDKKGGEGVITGVAPATGAGGEHGISLTIGEMQPGETTNVTLIYQLELDGAIDLDNKKLKPLKFKKSFDPMIVFR